MTTLASLRLNPALLQVPLYVAGKSAEEVEEELGLVDVIKLASNENALGPSPLALAAARAALLEAHRYPGIAERDLCRRLGPLSHPALDERSVLLGNGATDLIRLICQAFIFDGGEMITSRLTFPLYRICATMFGGRPVLVPPTARLQFNLPAIAAAIGPDTRLVFVCTPNNPTGTICAPAEIEAFLQTVPEHVVVVFDESYRDFVDDPQYPDPVSYVADGHNVVVIRSFSKGAGLASLRVGYALGRPELIEYLRRAQPPFNTGAPALAAANASLNDTEFLTRSRYLVAQERQYLCSVLDALGVAYVPSQANFVLVTGLPLAGTELAERLVRRGVIVRAMEGWGLPHAVRVSLSRREHNEQFAAALRAELRLAATEAAAGAPPENAGADWQRPAMRET